MPRFRVNVVGENGIMPSKCPKCTVDAVVLVEPSHEQIARVASQKLRLKVKDLRRVRLTLKSAVREHAAGTELPRDAELTAYLANDCTIAVGILEAQRRAESSASASSGARLESAGADAGADDPG